MNKYSGGGDRQFALEMNQGDRRRVDRVKYGEAIEIPHLSVGVLGSIQPDKLSVVTEGPQDGLAPRFLWAWPDNFPQFRLNRRRPADAHAEAAFKRLVDLQMYVDPLGNPEPLHVRLTFEAEGVLEAFGQHMQARGREAIGPYANALGKARGHALRVAGVLQHLWWCAGGGAEPQTISVDAINAAAGLMNFYFLPMAERVYGDATIPPIERNAMLLVRHLRKEKIVHFNARDLRKKIGGDLRKESEAMDEACELLVEAGLIRPDFTREGVTKGRTKRDYEVNPAVLRSAS